MHYELLYNPLSKNGETHKLTSRLARKLEKKGHTTSIGSLLDIKDVGEYISSLKDDDNIVILGGDGTMHHLANAIAEYDIKQNVFAVKNAGTGNDFVRSLKTGKRLKRINDYIQGLPNAKNDDGEAVYFVNSVGMGIDAYVCELVNHSRKGKSDSNYFKSTIKAFTKAQRFDLDVTIDGEKKSFKKVWFAVITNGKYFGGGMKLSPKSDRLDDQLEVVIVSGLSRFFLMLVFPTIYLGIHRIFKRWIKFYKAKHIVFEAEEGQYVQYDGESTYPVKKLEVHR